jgi:hypothetical protein
MACLLFDASKAVAEPRLPWIVFLRGIIHVAEMKGNVQGHVLDDDVTVGFRGELSLNDWAGVREIFSEYRPGDRWAFSLGLIWFAAPPSSSLGQYDANDMVYVIVKRNF